MKKLAASVVVAIALVLLPAQAASADLLDLGTGDLTAGVFPDDQFSTLNSSGHQFAVGGGTAGTAKFAFSAHNGPNGSSGYLVVKEPFFGTAQGHVNCYIFLAPREASFTIEVEKGSGFMGGLEEMFVHTLDRDRTGVPDFVEFGTTSGFPCPQSPSSAFSAGLVLQGNVVVKN
jgi:hypothetical protein